MIKIENQNILALQADPLDTLNFKTDSSLYIANEFQQFGFKIFFYIPQNLYYSNNQLRAKGNFISFTDHLGNRVKVLEELTLELKHANILMIRQNPPFDSQYLTNLYLLDNLPSKCLTINNPQAIRNCSEKLSVLKLPHLAPPTVISSNIDILKEFLKEHKNVVLKPIYGFGGNDVKLIDSSQMFDELIPVYLKQFGTLILQVFLPQVKIKGDKRVLIAGGKILGAITRTPAQGSILSNMVAGGVASLCQLTEKEWMIAQEVANFLFSKGIFLAGIDLLDNYLIEINVTSPTGFKTFATLANINLAKQIVEIALNNG